MPNKRETDLWQEIDKMIFIIAILGLIILIGAYFIITNLGNMDVVLREFFTSIIVNIIPTFLLFIGAYLVFRHIEKLRSERDTDELATKVAFKLAQIFSEVQASVPNEGNLLSQPKEFSELEMKLYREIEVIVKPFEPKLSPQKIIIECTYRGNSVIRFRKISYSGGKLGLSELSKDYRLDNNGHNVLIPVLGNKTEILPGEQFVMELILAQRWPKETIENWFNNLGYLHFVIECDNEIVDLQKAI